ncbi:DHA2 family efflux MFS transporter permease subunit [Planctomonas psychrotolerans]|uniref:DHA2 family efflux MFS transporter permease subunit n=1 Tax=Planctomonas psychrotolerans TaxID=2528712 RepID=UPI001D0D5499|nr:DHA2 family efflux MFS transporter permease subunit [Planctomonas psychrotolerans]
MTTRPDRRHLALTLLVAGTFFMENLDGTILATAAPSMARSFGVDSAAISITITSYLLTLAVLIPLSGWLSDRFGLRRVFILAIALFTIASALCAASTSLTELTIMRVFQGIGGAMMVPVGRLAVLRVTEKKDLIRAIAWLTWPALAAPVIAPLLGGLITTYATWPWIFLINIPLGIFAFFAALRLVPRSEIARPRALDWLGLLLTCAGIGALVYAGDLLAARSPQWVLTLVLAVVGTALAALAVRHMLRTAHPLLDLRAFRIETFRVAHAGGSMFRLTISAVPFLLPLFFQDALGWTPVQAGSAVLVLFAGNLVIKPLTTPMLQRFGFRRVLLGSTLGAALSMALVIGLADGTPLLLLIILMFFSGVTRSIGFTAYNTIAFADVPSEEMTHANTLASTVQQVAAGFGVAVGAIALSVGEPIARMWGSSDPESAFHVAFGILALLALVPIVETLRLSQSAGDNIRPAQRARKKIRPAA